MSRNRSQAFTAFLAFLVGVGLIGFLVPAAFVYLAVDEAYTPGAGLFGSSTPLIPLVLVPVVMVATTALYLRSKSAWSKMLLAGCFAGTVVLAGLYLLEILNRQ